MVAQAQTAMAKRGGPRYGIVSQGARYEGLITRIRRISRRVRRPHSRRQRQRGGQSSGSRSGPPVHARRALYVEVAPLDVLTWHEEEARYAVQNGTPAFMRNWPYAVGGNERYARPAIAGKFTVSPMPASGLSPTDTRRPTIGGAQLAINAYSRASCRRLPG